MEIIFVTGKGGVGKSAVAASLAHRVALQGKRTLLVELGDQSFFQDYFDLERVEYKPLQLRENFDLALWTGQESLKEYALHLIRVEALYRLFFENKVTKALMSIAPALPELAILGKITSGPPRNVGPKMNYDCIVVDSYASGHFMALIQAPGGMAEAVGFGPMGEQSRSIQKVISDASLCKYVVVSLPEELPVVEALELSEKIEKCVGVKPIHFLNRCLMIEEEDLKNGREVPSDFKKHIENSLIKQKQMFARFQSAGHHAKVLPWIFQHKSWSIISELSRIIEI